MQPLLTADQASDYLAQKRGVKVSPKTLGKYRVVGGGPPFRYFGRTPVYEDQGLDAWVDKKLSSPKHSTSEAA